MANYVLKYGYWLANILITYNLIFYQILANMTSIRIKTGNCRQIYIIYQMEKINNTHKVIIKMKIILYYYW